MQGTEKGITKMNAQKSVPIPRDHPRVAVRIPVQVRISHAWEGGSHAPTAGSLFNVSRGGAGLSMSRVVPPRTRLSIVLPTLVSDLRLLAEVVWTSHTPGRDPGFATYGVRWVEFLSRQGLEAMLPSTEPPRPDAGSSASPH
jgi:hypothetical protein